MNLSKLSVIAAATLAGAVGLQGTSSLAFQEGRPEPKAAQPSRVETRFEAVADDPPVSLEKLQAELAESKRAASELKAEIAQLRKQSEFEKSLNDASMRPGRREPSPAGWFPLGIGSRIIVESTRDGKAILYDSESKERHEFEVTDAKDGTALQILPITAPSVVGLEVRGPKIIRVAAALPREGGWFTQDLREPLDGKAVPMVGPATVVYSIGSHVYAFSAEAQRWDVVDLPNGVVGEPRIGLQNSVHLLIPGHTWIFNGKTGLWSHLDLKEILKDQPSAQP